MNKKKKNKKVKYKVSKLEKILLICCLILFSCLAILVATDNIGWFDNFIYGIISETQCVFLTNLFKMITFLCSLEFILVSTILVIVFSKKHRKLFSFNVIGCVLINQVLKHIFLRARPVGINLITESGYSFPSGHSMVGVAFYGYLIYLIIYSNLDKWKKTLFSSLLVLLILLIGISRIYLGVHFASDVIGGFALSLAYLIVFINFIYIKKEN